MTLTESIQDALISPVFLYFLIAFIVAYLTLAIGSFLYLYRVKAVSHKNKKIQQQLPSGKEIRFEILWSLSSLVVWSFMAVFLVALTNAGYTNLYFNVTDHGWFYFLISIPLLIITHDAYFYFVHVAMHKSNLLFSTVHAMHHESLNPTPFAIYSFSPLEAVIMGLYVYLIVFLIPVHVGALLALFIFDTLANTLGHSGYEFFPEKSQDGLLGKVFNTSLHHNVHHQYGRANFSLYFPFWDWVMRSFDTEYKAAWKEFHDVTKTRIR